MCVHPADRKELSHYLYVIVNKSGVILCFPVLISGGHTDGLMRWRLAELARPLVY